MGQGYPLDGGKDGGALGGGSPGLEPQELTDGLVRDDGVLLGRLLAVPGLLALGGFLEGLVLLDASGERLEDLLLARVFAQAERRRELLDEFVHVGFASFKCG